MMEWDDIFWGIALNSEIKYITKYYIHPSRHVIKSYHFCEVNVICCTVDWLHSALCDIY